VRVIIVENAEAVARRAARLVADLVRQKPKCVLGLAPGATASGLYQQLACMHREENLDFSQITTFNLHEYVGLEAADPQSCRYFMEENLFRHINVDPARTNSPDGCSADLEALGREYERLIQLAGGIDLQVLSIGRDGRLGFNEPGSSLGSRTRVEMLTGETIRVHARLFGSEEKVPRLAITMGTGTILDSRRCLLLAVGAAKASAVRSAIEGPMTAQVTASALQLHRDVVAVLDQEAAGWLTRREYYDEVEKSRSLLEAGQVRRLGLG
jgi:glucosamine-6-phosphate deaminase